MKWLRRALLLLLFPALIGCRQSPRVLFQEAVTNRIPASVQIIDATRRSRSGSVEVWLHFKIARQDFAALLKAEAFKELEGATLNTLRTAHRSGGRRRRWARIGNVSTVRHHLISDATILRRIFT